MKQLRTKIGIERLFSYLEEQMQKLESQFEESLNERKMRLLWLGMVLSVPVLILLIFIT